MISSLALVVVIVIDQFRMDEYFRIKSKLSKSGLVRLLDQGILYDDAHHSQFFNVTCPGHVAISTGSDPGLHGIMFNFDYDKKLKKDTYCTADVDNEWLEAAADNSKGNLALGTSAKRILTTTVGDEMKMLWKDDSKVVSVSAKDRAAIALAGHAGDGVYWYAPKSNIWTTSTAYSASKELPTWLKTLNKKINGRKAPPDGGYIQSLDAIIDTTDIALAAADAFQLGKHKKTDALWVSYSTHDYVSHHYGDDTKELEKAFIVEDQNIGRLVSELQKKIGNKKLIVVVTGDHGAGVDIKKHQKQNIPGGKVDFDKEKARINKCLNLSGVGSVGFLGTSSIHLSDTVKQEDLVDARKKAKQCLIADGSIWSAFTRDEILSNQYPQVPWLKSLAKSYNPARGPDVVGVLNPYWNSSDDNTISHETSYDYDSWVPLAVWWPGVKPRKIHRRVDITSLAPTLSRILETRRPSGATYELLTEVLDATH
ncbi:MAG: alkaline phosphatase family protein [Oligoflexia bacterium]|nr:alkaline phosphatase family protein [Oligoflexia bacterium]